MDETMRPLKFTGAYSAGKGGMDEFSFGQELLAQMDRFLR
jgi:hypothetical protein